MIKNANYHSRESVHTSGASSLIGDRQTDGVQADHGGVENLAAIERRKTIAESHRRCQIPKYLSLRK
jgi:hypothetical protein